MHRRLLVVLAMTACSRATPPAQAVQPEHHAVAQAPTATGSTCLQPSDCGSGETCFAPDFSPTGVTPCSDGEFCYSMGGEVCFEGRCVAPCTDTSCAPGYVCKPPKDLTRPKQRKCEAVPCNAPNGIVCADEFRCNASSGQCERSTCSVSTDCGAAPRACWQGHCYDHAGRCAPASYCCPP
jgi:hypothetical protein